MAGTGGAENRLDTGGIMGPRLRLEDKVAIVTGAGSVASGIGNGRAAAVLFAREGARVLLLDQNPAAAEETREMIRKEGGTAEVFTGDVSRADDCRASVERAVALWGKVDILHNNVGISGRGTILEADEALWDRVMAVNVKSMMLMGKYAVPVMASRKSGSIINISSIAALRPRGLTPYSTSKGAVIALTQAMAVDHAKDGIRVNCVVPGPMYTPMVYSRGMSEELRERRKKASPLGIEGTGWDIGYAALFLASDEARYITGVIVPVDGGVILTTAARG
jgi:NAD(P)-dependent dehydrogenase (short-subunit alcohol dehydrogenase family)